MEPQRLLTVVVTVTAVDLDGGVHAAHGRQRAPSPAPRSWKQRRQQAAAASTSASAPTDGPSALTGATWTERGGSCHLIGRERLRERGSGREAREVGGDLTDGADGTRTHVDGHVLLDGDG